MRQTKIVGILTNRSPEAIAKLRPTVAVLNRESVSGTLITGEEFRVIVCKTPEDVQKLRGLEFKRVEIVGNPHPDCVREAQTRVR